MIETLKGIQETVNFKNKSLIMFYDNKDYEDYPDHWHPPIEIIMPVNAVIRLHAAELPMFCVRETF
jgi:hypothetical protein